MSKSTKARFTHSDSITFPLKDEKFSGLESPQAISVFQPLARKYLLKFSDGSRKHIKREERDALLAKGRVRILAPGQYLYCGEEYKFRTLADLSRLAIEQSISGPRALPGTFLVESRKWVNESPDEDSPFVPVPIQYEEKLETPESRPLQSKELTGESRCVGRGSREGKRESSRTRTNTRTIYLLDAVLQADSPRNCSPIGNTDVFSPALVGEWVREYLCGDRRRKVVWVFFHS